MLGYESERRLRNFFQAIGDGERALESARQRLCLISDFAPRAAFDRIDRNASQSVSQYELTAFLREQGIYHVSDSEAFSLIQFFDGDGNNRMDF